ncbi:nuclear transport factor 2 family protein [Psychromicrobium sp. YIM B11713]|uniref:nuclear transport factor 2 family protein n=1 Tax=Psychromicrobium sp. YIM B11713 TaxID=3145233 RepID=UPI00374FB198
MTAPHPGKRVLQSYIDTINANDLEGLLGLFAEDVEWEDPYGSPVRKGREALREVYSPLIGSLNMTLDGPIRGSEGNRAAMAFSFEVEIDGKRFGATAIDVVSLNEAGLITHFQAYWSPGDLEEIAS